MYSNLRSLIFKIDPERAHFLAIQSLKLNLVSNIIGGFILKVDDKMYDASYRTKLKNIKKTLLNN